MAWGGRFRYAGASDFPAPLYVRDLLTTAVKDGYPKWDTPEYQGYDHMTVTSITIGSIEIEETTGEAPFFISASAANTTMSASRDYASDFNDAPSAYPFHMLEHKWTLTYLVGFGVVVEEGDMMVNAQGYSVNPYTGQVSPEFGAPVRRPGSYQLRHTARGPDGSGGYIEATTTVNITVSEPTYDHSFIDGLGGSELNDGFDPHGTALSLATYTESTGILSVEGTAEAGAFAGMDNDDMQSGNYTDWWNYLYIASADSGAIGTWHHFTVIDDNNIRLTEKIGSDQTNVVTSNGPKQVFTSQGNTDNLDTFVHLNGNKGLTQYSLDGDIRMNTGTYNNSNVKRIGGYNCDPDGVDITHDDGIFSSCFKNNNAGPSQIASIHNVHYSSGQNGGRFCDAFIDNASQTSAVTLFIDRNKLNTGRASTPMNLHNNTTYDARIYVWGNDTFQRTILMTAGNWPTSDDIWIESLGTTNWTSIGATSVAASALVEDLFYIIESAGTTDWTLLGAADNNVGTKFTANSTVGSGTGTALRRNFNPTGVGSGTGTAYSSSAHGMFTNPKTHDSRIVVMHNTWDVEGEDHTLDHMNYIKGSNDHINVAFNHFIGSIPSKTTGANLSACINWDYVGPTGGASDVTHYRACVDNYGEGTQVFVDMSGSNGQWEDSGIWEDVLIARNAFQHDTVGGTTISNGFLQPNWGGAKYAMLDNHTWGSQVGGTFHVLGQQHEITNVDFVVSRNKAYNDYAGTYRFDSVVNLFNDNARREFTDNIIWVTHTSAEMTRADWTYNLNHVLRGNNFYAPSDSDGNVHNDEGVGLKTLVQLNAARPNRDNVSSLPDWRKPSIGDFRSAA
jgi:hypothetical protein